MPAGTDQRLEARLRGDVQGVGFRHFVATEARRRPVTGFVRNEPDGTVAVVAEGPFDALHELLRAMREGPPSAIVDEVEVVWKGPGWEFEGFTVRF